MHLIRTDGAQSEGRHAGLAGNLSLPGREGRGLCDLFRSVLWGQAQP